MLADSFGRIATDLRVSVTDRCNLRCTYCMPAEGLDWLPGLALLTDDEVSRLISVAVQRLGITGVRFTGGEPLIRRGLPAIIARPQRWNHGRLQHVCRRWPARKSPLGIPAFAPSDNFTPALTSAFTRVEDDLVFAGTKGGLRACRPTYP